MSNNNSTTESEKEQWWERPWRILPALFVVIFIIWHAYWWIGDYCQQLGLIAQKDGVKNLSNFGDWFNALSALFAGWAFAALIYTIILQRTELRQTREEFRLQREELTTQSATFSQQTFENTLFQMIDVWRKMMTDIESVFVQSGYNKDDYFAWLYTNLNDKTKNSNYQTLYTERLSSQKRNNETLLGPFFRILYRIIVFIDSSEFDEKKKKFYTGIVRSQLSNYQLVIFFYNCQSIYGKDFQDLIRKYNLLKHCPANLITLDTDKQILKELQTNSDSTNSGIRS